MEDGRDIEHGGKYKGAKKNGTTILTEELFEELVQKLSGKENFKFGDGRAATLDMVPEESEIIQRKSGNANDIWTERYKPQ